MSIKDLLTSQGMLEKISSDADAFKSMLGLDKDSFNIDNAGEGLTINFVLCDVVMENVFSGDSESAKNNENYNRITIYFKPLLELSEDLSMPMKQSSCMHTILQLLNKDKEDKHMLIECYNKIQCMTKQLEQYEKQRTIIETRMKDSINNIKTISKNSINRRVIVLNKTCVRKLQQELTKSQRLIEDASQQLQELQRDRTDLEADISRNVDNLIDTLFLNFTIDKIDSI